MHRWRRAREPGEDGACPRARRLRPCPRRAAPGRRDPAGPPGPPARSSGSAPELFATEPRFQLSLSRPSHPGVREGNSGSARSGGCGMPRELRGDPRGCVRGDGRARCARSGMCAQGCAGACAGADSGDARGSPPALPCPALPAALPFPGQAEPAAPRSPRRISPTNFPPRANPGSPPAAPPSADPRAAPLPAAAPGAGGHRAVLRGRGPSASAHTPGGCGRCRCLPEVFGSAGSCGLLARLGAGAAPGRAGSGTERRRRWMRGERGCRSGTHGLLPAAALGWHSQSEQL